MNQYPKELKESIIARMLPPNNVGVPELTHETGIPRDTLYTWRRKSRTGLAPAESNTPAKFSSEEKFNIVLETASLNEVELGEYCRRKGALYPCRSMHGKRPVDMLMLRLRPRLTEQYYVIRRRKSRS